MSHTPGPWHCHFLGSVGEESEGGDFSLATGITTASIDKFLQDGGRGDLIAWVPHDRNERANANLIAAAPELLAALKAAVEVMKDHNIDEAISGEFEQFTDAIKKAEGNSSN